MDLSVTQLKFKRGFIMSKHSFEWAIIGAGPAGIASIGQLINNGVKPQEILWIDPKFRVGDFGELWSNVSSNTRVKLFNDFLSHCKSFKYDEKEKIFELENLPIAETCKLGYMVEPLAFVTQQLRQQVNCIESSVEKLRLYDKKWNMTLHDGQICSSKNVILATGAVPRSMPETEGVETIHMYDALDIDKLAKKVNKDDTVAVFGSSHSAVILLRDLLDLGVKEVINFYREPLRFAVQLDDWILFDNTGLKGNTAVWAREYLNGKMPNRLKRMISNDENVAQNLPICSKVIYAIGFNPRSPIIEDYPNYKYNPYNGIIAPGLFGVGIGFPESKTDRYGNTELSVGLWKFMVYLDRAVPLWLKYGV